MEKSVELTILSKLKSAPLQTGPAGGVIKLNVAVTDLALIIETVQVPVPVQAPDQPAKLEPSAGIAVSITEVPL